jgi:hypothetical protein
MTQTRILKIEDSEKRVETGPTQFNKDWPGLFIRGDAALGYAGAIEHILNQKLSPHTEETARLYLEELLELLQSSHETFQQDKKDKDHNTANDKHPLYLHKYKSVNHKVQHQYHQVHARYYDKLEDIPRPHLPNDDQMFDESIYELTPVPWYIVNEVKRKKREDAEYKRYLELKEKFEKLNKDTE